MATEKQKRDAWSKADKIRGKNPNLYRQDKYGNVLFWPSYGLDTTMGWEVDHSKPKSKGGTDHPNNLQALQTEENRLKGDEYPYRGQKPIRQRDLMPRRRRWG